MKKENLMNDKFFLRVYIGMVLALLAAASAMIIGFLFETSIGSIYIWLGSFLVYFSFFFIYIIPLPIKFSVIMMAILLIALYSSFVLGWAFMPSLIAGVAVVTGILFVYLIL